MHRPVLATLGSLPDLAPETVGAAIDRVVRGWVPATDDGYGFWDWFSVGGRFRGRFELLPGRTGLEGSLGLPEIVAMGGGEPPLIGYDIARNGDIDWQRSRWQSRATMFVGILFEDSTLMELLEPRDGERELGPVAVSKWNSAVRTIIETFDAATVLAVLDCHS